MKQSNRTQILNDTQNNLPPCGGNGVLLTPCGSLSQIRWRFTEWNFRAWALCHTPLHESVAMSRAFRTRSRLSLGLHELPWAKRNAPGARDLECVVDMCNDKFSPCHSNSRRDRARWSITICRSIQFCFLALLSSLLGQWIHFFTMPLQFLCTEWNALLNTKQRTSAPLLFHPHTVGALCFSTLLFTLRSGINFASTHAFNITQLEVISYDQFRACVVWCDVWGRNKSRDKSNTDNGNLQMFNEPNAIAQWTLFF